MGKRVFLETDGSRRHVVCNKTWSMSLQHVSFFLFSTSGVCLFSKIRALVLLKAKVGGVGKERGSSGVIAPGAVQQASSFGACQNVLLDQEPYDLPTPMRSGRYGNPLFLFLCHWRSGGDQVGLGPSLGWHCGGGTPPLCPATLPPPCFKGGHTLKHALLSLELHR